MSLRYVTFPQAVGDSSSAAALASTLSGHSGILVLLFILWEAQHCQHTFLSPFLGLSGVSAVVRLALLLSAAVLAILVDFWADNISWRVPLLIIGGIYWVNQVSFRP